jgi:hypothetical protein
LFRKHPVSILTIFSTKSVPAQNDKTIVNTVQRNKKAEISKRKIKHPDIPFAV